MHFFPQKYVEWSNWVLGHFTNAVAAAGMLGYFKSSSTDLESMLGLKTAFNTTSFPLLHQT